MKRFLKGFTLIELIVVMAIMSILMLAIMQMMKPIRQTYVDSTFYEAQRNTQNGVVKYITENLRYADNIGIYTVGQTKDSTTISNVTSAITAFKAKVKNPDGTELSDSQINIITIDNTTGYSYNEGTFHGRLVRSKAAPASGFTTDAEVAGTAQARLALGDAYYGDANFSINVDVVSTDIKVSVASMMANTLGKKASARSVKTEDIAKAPVAATDTKKFVITEGMACCENVALPGKVLDSDFKATATTTQGKDTYIIFTYPQ